MTKKEGPRFTVFTPTFNSTNFIRRVYDSLVDQTEKSFEWLIIDDCSSDQTVRILQELRRDAGFNIRIYENDQNRMLSYSFDRAIALAKGEFFIAVGHDDCFDPDTIEAFGELWDSYGSDSIAAVWCHCRDENGHQIGPVFEQPVLVSNYFDMFFKHLYTFEKFHCYKTNVLKYYSFQIDGFRYAPESITWGRVALDYDTIFSNRVLRTYYRDNPTALTKGGRARGAAAAAIQYEVFVNEFLERINGFWVKKLRIRLAYVFHSSIAGRPASEIIRRLTSFQEKVFAVLLLPFGYLFKLMLND